mgnify:CR=1 FL=1
MENQTIDDDQINMHEEMRRAFALLSGKWKLEIMWLLNQRVYRFGELRKAINGITQHMLTAQLRDSTLEIRLQVRIAYSSTCPCSAALSRQLIQQQFVDDFGDNSLHHADVLIANAAPLT